MNCYLLIGGSPRSGTSFLASTLNSIADIALFAEFSLSRCLQIGEQLFQAMEDYQYAPFDPSAVEQFLRPTNHEHKEIFIKSLWTGVYNHKNPKIIGNKSPALAAFEDIDALSNSPHDIKYIYIFRKFSGVLKSTLKRAQSPQESSTWLIKNVEDSAWEWLHSLLIGQYLKGLGVDVLFIKYEDLLKDSKEEAKRISLFLGLDGLDFKIMQSKSEVNDGMGVNIGFTEDVMKLLDNWDFMSADQISEANLDGMLSALQDGSWPLALPFCDIGSMKNFHNPEPWGSWSKPGYFSVIPRFATENKVKKSIEFYLTEDYVNLNKINFISRVNDLEACCSLSLVEGSSILTVYIPEVVALRKLQVDVFFNRCLRFPNDSRLLGVAVKSYRVFYSDT